MGHKLRATGGHGGDGGDVIIEASNHMNGLSFQTYVITAPSGEDATGVYRLAGLFVWPTGLVPYGVVRPQVLASMAGKAKTCTFSFPAGQW